MAIPIRNYPYTDYHDLNLDFLLRNWTIFQADLEELKRRVKALEDWREVAEPDINTLKSQMLIVIGDIANIKPRLTLVENEVSVLAGNCKAFYICVDPNAVITLREGDPLTGSIIDLTDPDTLSAFVARLRSSLSSVGEINDRYFYYIDSAADYYELTPSINQRGIEFTYNIVSFTNDNKRITRCCTLDPDTGTISSKSYLGGISVFINNALLPSTSESYRYDDSEYPEYPYQYDIISDKIFASSMVLCFPWRISDFEAISDNISEYVKVTNGKATLFLKEVPANTIVIEVHAIG